MLGLVCFSILTTIAIAIPFQNVLPQLDGRIVGGQVVDISKHPHQISLRYKSCLSCGYSHRCGGSIYSARIVITELTDNDVAVLVLAASLPLNSYEIKAIKLADSRPSNGATAIVTGWGTTKEGGNLSRHLLQVKIPIISNALCQEAYGARRITESMLCAGAAKGGKDACQGDSGGPLVVNRELVGIVSWGRGCARPDYPGVYANVGFLRPWLDNVIRQNSYKS